MNKTLEALNRIKNIPILSTPESTQKIFYDKHKKDLDIIEDALKRKEELERMHTNALDKIAKDRKKLKAFDIIKEKNVDVQLLKDSKNLNDYNWCVHTKDRALIQDEFDLLKEVLL